jgi:protein-S-isoprenylcysteine O-methyltransferase Ste14
VSRWINPPFVLAGHLWAMAGLHFLWPGPRWIDFPLRWAGVVISGSAGLLFLYAARQFHRHDTTSSVFAQSTALITGGVFGYSRNPMYLAMLMMLIGAAVFLGTVTPWCLIPSFIIMVTQRFIRPEEHLLESRFEADYREYRSRVGRWVWRI